jgi:ABC-2 type transport system ATP-binding protein
LPRVESLASRAIDESSLWEVSLQAEDSRQVLPLLLERVNHNGTHLVNMNILKPSLEDVFIQLTGKALRD